MPSVEENKLKKRNKILEAAYNLFAKNGINTTPIDEVVKCAGVAKGTFYLYALLCTPCKKSLHYQTNCAH